MWLIYAIGSAFFAGVTSILAKCGIRKTDSNVATAVRTIVVLLFSWVMVWIVGSGDQITSISGRTLLFLILSGAATGASWLCYFHALQIGDINKVVPVDKSSTALTILLALIFLGEGISLTKAAATAVIALGIFLMIERKDPSGRDDSERDEDCEDVRQQTSGDNDSAEVPCKKRINWKQSAWLAYAAGSAFFASLTAILGKVGISGVESNLGTAIRTCVVLVIAWVMVFVTGKQREVRRIDKKELRFICLSGIATGASWICYYRALQEGPASVVTPIDKLSVIVTVVFSYFVFGEKLSKKAMAGLALLTVGTVAMAVL